MGVLTYARHVDEVLFRESGDAELHGGEDFLCVLFVAERSEFTVSRRMRLSTNTSNRESHWSGEPGESQ